MKSPRQHCSGLQCGFIVTTRDTAEQTRSRKTEENKHAFSLELPSTWFLPMTTRSELSLICERKRYRKYWNYFPTKRSRISTLHIKSATFQVFWLWLWRQLDPILLSNSQFSYRVLPVWRRSYYRGLFLEILIIDLDNSCLDDVGLTSGGINIKNYIAF